jgi:hypothetical protein
MNVFFIAVKILASWSEMANVIGQNYLQLHILTVNWVRNQCY